MFGLTHLAKVYPLSSGGSGQAHLSASTACWPCRAEPLTFRDVFSDRKVVTDQWLASGPGCPILQAGWKLEVFLSDDGVTFGTLVGTFHVQDPATVAGPVGRGSAIHHQEVRLGLVRNRNI